MYCSNCGKEINPDAMFCSHCGYPTQNHARTQPNPINDFQFESFKKDEKNKILYFLLGFFLPIVGLILYIVWRTDYPIRAENAGKGALISVIVSAVLFILYLIVILSVLSSLTI